MLSIGVMANGQEDYYTHLAREDYFLRGGEPEGHWMGGGVAHIRLQGAVTRDDLRAVFRGFSPAGKELVQNAGKENRRPGWDLTFSVPKSVSVLWSQASEPVPRRSQEMVAESVEEAVKYLEEEAAFCRVGKGGAERVRPKLVVGAFAHGTSRALDPQYHIHCLVMNAGVCEDGKTRALVSHELYEHKMVAGAYFRAALGQRLRTGRGLELLRPADRKGNPRPWFEVRGVPQKLIEVFSKRRAAIERALGSRNLETAAAAAVAALETRETKKAVPPRGELLAEWQAEGRKFEFDAHAVEQLLGQAAQRDKAADYQACLAEAVERITWRESHFSVQELLRETLEAGQDRGLEPGFVRRSIERDVLEDGRFVGLGTRDGVALYTTRKMIEVEKALLKSVEELHGKVVLGLDTERVGKTIHRACEPKEVGRAEKMLARLGLHREGITLNQEQAEGLRYLTDARSRVKCVCGLAGSGKTELLSVMREVYEKAGYKVIGCAVAGVAAKGLERKTGIVSDTVKMRLCELYPTVGAILRHHAKQLVRAALKKRTYELNRLKINGKTVMVVDEAGMVGTREFALLAKAVAKGGGILICVGDVRQLPSIEAGGAFGSIVERCGCAELKEVARQRDPRDREAVKALARGDAETALREYARRGCLYVGANRETTGQQLLRDWQRSGGVERPEKHVILVATNQEVEYYNERAQRIRAAAGKLDTSEAVQVAGATLYPGDRVMFVKKSRALGVENGDMGTLVAVKPWTLGSTVAVKVDGRKEAVIVPIRKVFGQGYDGLRRGYCFTTHKLQGATVDHLYVHLGGGMTDREMSYVQGSRHRESLRLYTDEREAGHKLTAFAREARGEAMELKPGDRGEASPLVKQMEKSKLKRLAHDLQEEQTRGMRLEQSRSL